MEESWFKTACRRYVVWRSVKISLFVGTILICINQADAILAGSMNGTMIAKIVLTYLVPYGVSTFAAVQAIRNPPA